MAKLIDQIDSSGLFAQSAYSAAVATNDDLGRKISTTYLTGVDLSNYYTKNETSSMVKASANQLDYDLKSWVINQEFATEYDLTVSSEALGNKINYLSGGIDYVSANVGGSFPASANEACQLVQSNSGRWNTAYLPISAVNVMIGENNYATNNAFVAGYRNSGAQLAFAYGADNTARQRAVAFGSACTADFNALAVGRLTKADSNAFACGDKCTAYGESIAVGESAVASTKSIALGTNSIALEKSVSIGPNTSGGYYGISIGNNCSAADFSVAIGPNHSEAMGSHNVAIGNCRTSGGIGAVAIGFENMVQGSGWCVGNGLAASNKTTVFGCYNSPEHSACGGFVFANNSWHDPATNKDCAIILENGTISGRGPVKGSDCVAQTEDGNISLAGLWNFVKSHSAQWG